MRIFLAILLVLLVGCSDSTVTETVENSLSWQNPEGANLDVSGHKDTTIKGLKVTRPDGTVIQMDEYQSVGNAAAIAEAGAAERERLALVKLIAELAASKIPVPSPGPEPTAVVDDEPYFKLDHENADTLSNAGK